MMKSKDGRGNREKKSAFEWPIFSFTPGEGLFLSPVTQKGERAREVGSGILSAEGPMDPFSR